MNNNEMSPMLMAYINGIYDYTELLKIGIFSLVQKGYINVDSSSKNLIYSINKEKSLGWLPEEESLILEAMKKNEDNILNNNKRIYRLSIYILEIMKEEQQRLYEIKYDMFFLIGFLILMFQGFVFFYGTVKLAIFAASVILFILTISFGFLLWKSIKSKILLLKIVGIFFFGFFFLIFFIFWGSFTSSSQWWSLLYLPFLYFLYYSYKNRKKYTDRGKKIIDEIDTVKSNFNENIKNEKYSKFATEEELVEYFKEFLPISLSLKIENKMNNYIEKTIENSSLNKEKVYEKLNISAYNDKTIYNKLIKNYISSPEYKNNGQTYEILTRKGKKELWI